MEKVAYHSKSNDFCMQSMFMYGTYNDAHETDFGLFNWFTYCWHNGERGVIACLGGSKMTKDRIRQNGVFSANLVTEPMLPLADFCGNVSGGSEGKKERILKFGDVRRGEELDVPTLGISPWTYELETISETHLDGSDVFICRVAKVTVDARLADESLSVSERLRAMKPMIMGHSEYFATDCVSLGKWGEPMKRLEGERS